MLAWPAGRARWLPFLQSNYWSVISHNGDKMGVSENSVPLNPMALLIIIPFLNGYFIGNIPYFQTNPNDYESWYPALWINWGGDWSWVRFLEIKFRRKNKKNNSNHKEEIWPSDPCKLAKCKSFTEVHEWCHCLNLKLHSHTCVGSWIAVDEVNFTSTHQRKVLVKVQGQCLKL